MAIKTVIVLLVGLTLASVRLVEAQQPTKIPRIAYLSAGSASSQASRIEVFKHGLRDLGYAEGKDIIIEQRYAEGKLDRVAALAAELVGLKVDIIVTGGPAATRSAKEATATIPIVMGFDYDPVGSGVVASLARPGGNVTGLSSLAPEISGKQLELLKEVFPEALPRRRSRQFDGTGYRTIAQRGGTRRRSVQGAASIPRRTGSEGY
jgi:putative tryptophan/tyrosine transport system substrate-binding protein